MHQALPHEHHTHDKSGSEEVSQSSHTHVESHHHHNGTHTRNHHHNSDQQQVKGHLDGLLGLILGNHSHFDGADHVPVVKTPSPQNFKIKDLGKSLFAIATTSSSMVASGSSQAVYGAANIQYYQYHPFISLRGPPKYI